MNETVLIAHGDTAVVDLLVRCCRARGLMVESADNALTALSKMADKMPDVVILDSGMFYEDGLTLGDLMADHKDLGTIPVIVLADHASEEAVRGSNQQRAHHIVNCPDLWSRIEPVLEDLFDLTKATEPQPQDEPLAPPNADEMRGPMNLIDAVFAVLGVETGECLFEDDLSDENKRSDQPWVLCIDDDDDIALALRLRLKEFGAQVIRATEGMEGCRRAFTQVPRAIILDYELPHGNGDYVLRRLKESPTTRNIPVIVLTGHRETSIERKMWELGASEYLTKPLDWSRLRVALQLCLEVKKPIDHSSKASDGIRLTCVGSPDFVHPQ
jgi:DNA-binding response OmpR family regulator